MGTLIENFNSLISPAIKAEDFAFVPNDSEYASFLGKYNGGYFYERAFHFYGFDNNIQWHDILLINASIQSYYSNFSFSKSFFAIGCDALFTQYGFYKGNVVSLDIYSGELEIIANSFNEFITKLEQESDFYTASSLLAEYESVNGKLKNGERLAAKKPFVLGGEYNISNLRILDQQKLLDFAAFIANEINGLPDGSNILLKTE